MLWVFGDSFSLPREHINQGQGLDYSLWLELISQHLSNGKYFNSSEWGVSNEYILDSFVQTYNNIGDDDFVIVQLTSSYRQWFFEDKPDLANYYTNNIDRYITAEQHAALMGYISHLQHKKVDMIRYKSLEYCLKYIAANSSFKMLILPGFDPVEGVNGTLLDICDGEFVDTESRDRWYKKHGADPRANHMSPANHQILAEKVIDYFQNGNIDLTKDFQQKFL